MERLDSSLGLSASKAMFLVVTLFSYLLNHASFVKNQNTLKLCKLIDKDQL